MKPFDIIDIISRGSEFTWDEEMQREYKVFLINRGLSLHHDTVMFANEMNTIAASKLPKKIQFDFFYYGIKPKKKRVSKWYKAEDDEVIDLICAEYNCSKRVAEDYRRLLKPADLEEIRQRQFKGGRG